MKKVISLILCIVMAATLFVACGEKEISDNPDEHVTLKWVTRGPGKLEDSEKVWAEFNKMLAEYLPNTTVEFQMIPSADYVEKFRLMSAAQEPVDICWVSFNQNFVEEVGKGSYMDITDLIEEYGQDMKAGFPDWLLDLTTVDGRIYAIPNYQMMAFPSGFGVPVEHIEKGWIDLEKAEEVFCSGDVPHKEDYKIFEDYLTKVQESGEDVKYVASNFLSEAIKFKYGLPYMGVEEIVCNAVFLRDGDDFKVYDRLTDFPENNEYYGLINEWNKKGFIRSDILEKPAEKASDYLLWSQHEFIGSEETLSKSAGRPMEIFTYMPESYVPYKGSSTNTAIAAQSKHPERAMQLLNLLNSEKGKDLLNLLAFGIEGEHYEKLSENRIKWLEPENPGSSSNRYGYEVWALGNALVAYETDANPEGWNDYCENEINAKATISRLKGFSLDTKPIQLEIAQYNAKWKEYTYLEKAAPDNWEELIAERNAQLKKAGSDKIVAEVQRQVDEWLKTQK